MDGRKDGWKEGWIGERMDGKKDGWERGWIGKRVKVRGCEKDEKKRKNNDKG